MLVNIYANFTWILHCHFLSFPFVIFCFLFFSVCSDYGDTGALNEMDLVLNNLSADKCFEKFTEFAKKVFEFEKTPIYGNFKWVRFLSGILRDGKYDAEGLEEILKHGLSSYRRIFDFGTTSGISSRICIIASRVSDGKACVMANYRGIGIRPAESAYEFLTPGGGQKDPLLWQA